MSGRRPESPIDLDSLSGPPPLVEDDSEEEVKQQQVLGSNDYIPRWRNINEAPEVYGFRYGWVQQSSCKHTGVLPDTISLRDRLRKKLALERLRITLYCCEVLNNGVDVYLKRLMEACLGIMQPQGISGRQNIQMMPGSFPTRPAEPTRITMPDFKDAMESVLLEGIRDGCEL